MPHTKAQLRSTALDIIFERERLPDTIAPQRTLGQSVAYIFAKHENLLDPHNLFQNVELAGPDRALFDEVFWDLVIERIIIPGPNTFDTPSNRFRIRSDASPETE
jgi:hypothetical protein